MRLLVRAGERAIDPVLVCPPGDLADLAGRAGIAQVPIRELSLSSAPAPVAGAGLALAMASGGSVLRHVARGAHVVVANGIRSLAVARLAGLGEPVVWLVHSVVDRPRWRLIARACAKAVDRAVAVSPLTASSLGRVRFGVDVIWNGTPWPVEPAPLRRSGPPVVGCAGLLTSWKGQHVLLEAVARLGRDDVRVELVGGHFPKDAGYVESLRRRASELDLTSRVSFAGHSRDPLAAMRGWSVAAVPSVEADAGPLVAIEAMSLGLPVVVTSTTGVAAIVGEAGMVVAPGDAEALAEALNLLLDPARRSRCFRSGRSTVANSLSLEKQVDLLVDAVVGLPASERDGYALPLGGLGAGGTPPPARR